MLIAVEIEQIDRNSGTLKYELLWRYVKEQAEKVILRESFAVTFHGELHDERVHLAFWQLLLRHDSS